MTHSLSEVCCVVMHVGLCCVVLHVELMCGVHVLCCVGLCCVLMHVVSCCVAHTWQNLLNISIVPFLLVEQQWPSEQLKGSETPPGDCEQCSPEHCSNVLQESQSDK